MAEQITEGNTTCLKAGRRYLQTVLGPNFWMERKEDPDCFNNIVEVIRNFPLLSSEVIRWGRFVFLPLSLLLLSRSQPTLDIVRDIYALHNATIDECSKAMLRRQEYKFLHLTVLDRYPDLVTIKDSQGGRILDFAFHRGYPAKVLDCILQNSASITSITIRGPCSLSGERVHALEKLMQSLTQLKWVTYTKEGLEILLSCLEQENSAIVQLDLAFSPVSPMPGFFQRFLAENVTA